jgi:hypothetical protein
MPLTIIPPRTGTWCFASAPPAEWPEWVRRAGGGFFHSPLGLEAGAPGGTPLYAWYIRGDSTIAVALGVVAGCRLGLVESHAHFPTWPAFAEMADRSLGLSRLGAVLRNRGIAEARWDAFDSAATAPPAAVPTRGEYLLDLSRMDDASVWPPSTEHRRKVRHGEREGWTLTRLTGSAAVEALTAVMDRVAGRIASRGGTAVTQVPPMAADLGEDRTGHAETWAATRGGELLAAVLLGVGETRAYYVMGGATTAGYGCGASAWLHARVAGQLANAGLRHYNLGGAPIAAKEPGDPAHGLHRFKTGFGAEVVPCAGDRWVLRPTHVHGHGLLRWALGRAG